MEKKSSVKINNLLIIATSSILSLFRYSVNILIYPTIEVLSKSKIDKGINGTFRMTNRLNISCLLFLFDIKFFTAMFTILYIWINNGYLNILFIIYSTLIKNRY